MKCLITGGAGFIGSHIADALVQKNYEVRVLDNFSTGKRNNIKHLEGMLEAIEGDIIDKKTVDEAVSGVDYIFHQAAQVSVVESVKNPAKTWDINIKGTKLLLNAAVESRVKKVIIASSAAVYGNDGSLPKTEDMKPNPVSPYGNSKLMNEYMAENYLKNFSLKTICLRYFNVYGPRQSPKSEYASVISRFISLMLKGARPTIYGDGRQTRDFVYVADVVKANLLAMESKKVNNSVFNIATGKQTSINDIVKTINTILGTDISPTYAPERPGDIRHSVADISKAKRKLGYKPEYDLKKGLEKTIEWCRSHST